MDSETIEKNTFGKSVGAEERIISKSFFEQEGDDEKLTVSSKMIGDAKTLSPPTLSLASLDTLCDAQHGDFCSI